MTILLSMPFIDATTVHSMLTGCVKHQMVEIYQIRWTIEVLFKESKQLLGLGKCQSNDYDAQIADSTITLIQHLLLCSIVSTTMNP